MEERPRESVHVEHPRCPFCHDGVAPLDPKVACDACMAWHHAGCWSDHGGCSACGNLRRGRTEAAKVAAGPAAHGQGIPCSRSGCSAPAVSAQRALCAAHALAQARRSIVFLLTFVIPVFLVSAWTLGREGPPLSFLGRSHPRPPAELVYLLCSSGLLIATLLLVRNLRAAGKWRRSVEEERRG